MSAQRESSAGGALGPIIPSIPFEPYQMVSVSARVISDDTGADTYIPIILTPYGPVLLLMQYFKEMSHRSLSWMEQVTRAVMRFQDYLAVSGMPQDDWSALFNQFADLRLGGTISVESRVDPSGLGWEGLTDNVAATEREQLKGFLKWAVKKLVATGKARAALLENFPDEGLSKAALAFRRDFSLLGHLWNDRPSRFGSRSNSELEAAEGQSSRHAGPVKAFPEDKLWNLVFEALDSGDVLELQVMLHLLLINCGGFRSSEPPHLWVQDAYPDPANPEMAIVRIFHPSEGAAPTGDGSPSGKHIVRRSAYLRQRYGLSPRNLLRRGQRSGWKGGFHDNPTERYKTVHWFPTYAGTIFLRLWNAYIPLRAALPDRSPFAFVSFTGENAGFGFNRKALNRRYQRACRRIGLTGTTEDGSHQHGSRHAYLKRLVKADVDRETRRRVAHHRHADSQDVYTAPTDQEIAAALAERTERLKESSAAFQQKYGAKLDATVARAEGDSQPD